MHTRTHNWLLIIIALALAVAPLRGAWSMPVPAETEKPSHCAQMDMQQPDTANVSGHIGDQDCDGSCCDGACNACAHAASAISDAIIITPEFHDTSRDERFRVSFPERTVVPPLRPPASL
jgi:hypothetical protein